MSASAKSDTPRTLLQIVRNAVREFFAPCGWVRINRLERELTAARAEAEALRNNYMELIMAVESAWPNETRHQTALRYIEQRERASDNTPSTAIDAARSTEERHD